MLNYITQYDEKNNLFAFIYNNKIVNLNDQLNTNNILSNLDKNKKIDIKCKINNIHKSLINSYYIEENNDIVKKSQYFNFISYNNFKNILLKVSSFLFNIPIKNTKLFKLNNKLIINDNIENTNNILEKLIIYINSENNKKITNISDEIQLYDSILIVKITSLFNSYLPYFNDSKILYNYSSNLYNNNKFLNKSTQTLLTNDIISSNYIISNNNIFDNDNIIYDNMGNIIGGAHIIAFFIFILKNILRYIYIK